MDFSSASVVVWSLFSASCNSFTVKESSHVAFNHYCYTEGAVILVWVQNAKQEIKYRRESEFREVQLPNTTNIGFKIAT